MNRLDVIVSSIGIFLLSILTLNHWYRGLYYEPLALLLLIVISPTIYHLMRLFSSAFLNNKRSETQTLPTSFDEYKEEWTEYVHHDFCNTCGYAMQGCVCKAVVNEPTDSQ